MTAPAIHLWRLLKWGRILARHGALSGIERDPNTPTPVRRLARIARIGARVPKVPRYADALQAIGPAAIKLGQTLATRPDIVGESASADLLRLQDALPAVPYETIHAAMTRAFGRDPAELFASIDPVPVGAASIAQVHKGVTTDGRTVAIKVLRPGVEGRLRPRDRHLSMGRRACRSVWRRTRPPAATPRDRDVQALDRARTRLAARGGVRVRTGGRDDRRARFS